MARIFRLLRQTWFPPADPQTSFRGKNVIVTGANTGIGFEAATKFAALGASRVILGVRDLAKGDRAKEAIEKRTGRTGQVEVWNLDMNSYESIQEFARRASSDLDHLDIVVLNAGVFMVKYDASTYGWEQTLQVNVLSTALLGLLLLPGLKRTAERTSTKPVLEVVASKNHLRVTIPKDRREHILQSYNTAEGYNTTQQYNTSKLFVMHVMQTLASFAKSGNAIAQPQVIVTSVCPGTCKSEMARGYDGFLGKVIIPIITSTVFRTPEQGSRSLVSGVTLGDEAHGRFWHNDQLKP
jgi:NAD(P)-dependent dehydrogenase (short-subunit alcohol dehydrogenase family)